MIARRALAVLAAVASPVFAQQADRFVELGPTKAQRDSGVPALEFPFIARADEQIKGASVRIAFAPRRGDAPAMEGLEVLVNEERVALLPADEIAAGGPPREIAIDEELLADRNLLSLRLQDREGRCVAQPGAWRSLQSVGVVLQATPVPLPNDLALLPIPFFDRGFDTKATIPVVLGQRPTAESARLAAILASWFAVDAPIPLSFEARLGSLPDSPAIVLVAGPEEASLLGLEPPDGPLVRMIDHPRYPASNVKLLVVGGRTPAELRSAVEAVAARTERLVGAEVRLRAAAPQPSAAPYSAPRWAASGRPMRFSDFTEASVFAHEGSTPATLSVRFRVAPDLWIWPAEFVDLDLSWSERLPAGSVPPRLDVEMNGYFVGTLPRPKGQGDVDGRVRLRIPREHMRGFNQLLVHVHYPEPDPCAAATAPPGSRGDPPRVALSGDSRLHVERFRHFASLPDVSLFAFDGYPFARVPDLSETAVVLPDRPAPAELSMALAVFGQLAQVTGRVGTRASFLPASRVTEADLRDKDVLLIGTAEDNRLLERWGASMPFAFDARGPRVRRPSDPRALLDLLGGADPLLDVRSAEGVLSRGEHVAAITAIESPVAAGRSAVAITASSPDRFPAFEQFLGYAQSRTRSADLLLLSGNQRWMFKVGTSFGRGQLDEWTRIRWFLATHWIALLPLLLVGVLVLALHLRRAISRRMRERLALGTPA